MVFYWHNHIPEIVNSVCQPWCFTDITTRLAKCRQKGIFAMPVAFTGKYWQIMENTGKYDLQPSTFRLVITIIEVI